MMKVLSITLLLTITSTLLNGQWSFPFSATLAEASAAVDPDRLTKESSEAGKAPVDIWKLDCHPEFPGGQSALITFLRENINYPELAQENGIEGTLILLLQIREDGQITQTDILRGLGCGIDENVLRAIERMPRWEPAVFNGKNVTTWKLLPVRFRLAP